MTLKDCPSPYAAAVTARNLIALARDIIWEAMCCLEDAEECDAVSILMEALRGANRSLDCLVDSALALKYLLEGDSTLEERMDAALYSNIALYNAPLKLMRGKFNRTTYRMGDDGLYQEMQRADQALEDAVGKLAECWGVGE